MDVKIVLDDKYLGNVQFSLNSKIFLLKEYGQSVIRHYSLPVNEYDIDIYLNRTQKLDLIQINNDLTIGPYKHLFTDPYIHIHKSLVTKFENLRKDEIFYLGMFMDPQTVLNLAKTNTRYRNIFNEDFWRIKMEKDYPGFIKEKETWKKQYFFLFRLRDRIYKSVEPISKERIFDLKISEDAAVLISKLIEPIIYPLMLIRGNNPEFDHKIMESAIKNAIPKRLGKQAWIEYKKQYTIEGIFKYLITVLVELSGNLARSRYKKNIEPLDIYRSIYRDEEIFGLFYNYLPAFPFDTSTGSRMGTLQMHNLVKELNFESTEEYDSAFHYLRSFLSRFILYERTMPETLTDITIKARKIQPNGALTLDTLLEVMIRDKYLSVILNEYKKSKLK